MSTDQAPGYFPIIAALYEKHFTRCVQRNGGKSGEYPKEMATGWALNNRYNHQYISAFGEPDPTPPSTIMVDNMQNGTYALRWYDPETGTLEGNDVALANNGILSIPLGSFLWDKVFIVDNPLVATEDIRADIAIEVYPNPVRPGGTVQFRIKDVNAMTDRIALLDPTGREVLSMTPENDQIIIPAGLPDGPYWVKFESRNGTSLTPIVVVE